MLKKCLVAFAAIIMLMVSARPARAQLENLYGPFPITPPCYSSWFEGILGSSYTGNACWFFMESGNGAQYLYVAATYNGPENHYSFFDFGYWYCYEQFCYAAGSTYPLTYQFSWWSSYYTESESYLFGLSRWCSSSSSQFQTQAPSDDIQALTPGLSQMLDYVAPQEVAVDSNKPDLPSDAPQSVRDELKKFKSDHPNASNMASTEYHEKWQPNHDGPPTNDEIEAEKQIVKQHAQQWQHDHPGQPHPADSN